MTLLDYQISVQHGTLIPDRKHDIVPTDDPFFYGWREVPQHTNGSDERVRVPLTLDDVLHPQLGDYIVQNYFHAKMCNALWDGLEGHLVHEKDTAILHDHQIDWEHETIRPLCPDVAVIRHTRVIKPKECFYVKQSGGRVDLVVEVTSPSTWKIDVEGYHTPNKVQLYEELGVDTFIIVDAKNQQEGQPPPIKAYKLGTDGQYEEIDPDDRGWLWIDVVGLWIGTAGEWVSWYDAEGNKIGTYVEVNEARKQEREARQRAEEHAHTEAEARQRAEDRIRELEARLRTTNESPGQ